MIVAAAFLLAGAGSLTLIARELCKAPEGYEDDHGFHTVHQDKGGCPLSQRPLLLVRSLAGRNVRRVNSLCKVALYRGAEDRTEQHDCGAAIGNPWSAWAKEYPPGKAMPTRTIFRNRDYST